MKFAGQALVLVAAALSGLGLVPLPTLLGAGRMVPWWPVAVHEWWATGPVVLAVALVVAIVLGARLDRWGAWLAALTLRPPPRVFGACVAGLAFLLTATFAVYCFARAPFSQDEMAQRFQARLLLAGHLFARGETHPEFFAATGILDASGRWYSMYPIGGPALLALGMAFRIGWLVNPALTAFTAWNLYRFVAAAWNEGAARASVLLFALSPFVLIMGGSEMNHVAALAFTSLALAALPAWAEGTGRGVVGRAAAQLGLGVGGLAAVRPLDAALVGGLIGVFQLAALRHLPGRRRSLLVQLAAGALPLGVLLCANAATTGHPFRFAYEGLYGPGVRLGFHDDPYGVPFTPLRALLQTSAGLLRLDRYLFEWPLPGLVPIIVALLALRRPSRWDLLLVGLMGAIVVGYGFYWFDGFFAGPRFLYTAVPAFVVLAARSPGLAAGWAPEGSRLGGAWRRTMFLVVPLCVAYAWTVPTGAASVRQRAYLYHASRTKLKTDIAGQVARAGLPRALVFVHEGWRARLQARLRGFGFPPGDAERVLNSSDACQVQRALDDEAARPPADSEGRLARLLNATRPAGPVRAVPGLEADETVLLSEPVSLTPICRLEIAADSGGDTPFPPFLALETFERDGSLGGPVVFARDLGPANELLRARFPGRAWYRYRPRRSLDDTTAAIVPY